jgi:DNA-binding GntR family transcriptional regulator
LSGISLADEAAKAIREKILEGLIPPGAHINIATLTKDLGISQTPIREALKKLIPDGLVVYRTKVGYTVRVLTLHEYLQVSEIHQALEIHLVRELAKTPSIVDYDALAAINDALDLHARAGETAEVGLKNDAFHRKLYVNYPNKLMVSRLIDLWNEVRLQRDIMYQSPAFLSRVADEHRSILRAIRGGRPDEAAETMSVHYVSGRQGAIMAFPTDDAH